VLENRVLRRIFGPKMEEVVGSWRRLYNKLHNLYLSPNIRLIKSWRLRWLGHVAHKEDVRYACRILVRSVKGIDHMKVFVIDGRIVL
jgi:phosphatidylserine/phosphatidylglycerophosphate/cardiolipin synthase-like enzyme